MLSILTAHHLEPEIEAIDRDPGIIALAAGLVRTTRRCLVLAFDWLHTNRDVPQADPRSASRAQPHRLD